MKYLTPLACVLLAGCQLEKKTAPTNTPQLLSITSFAQPLVVQPPPEQTPYSLPATAFSWNSQTDVVGFNIYYGTFPHSYEHLIFATNNCCIITNLVIGMRYYFAATAMGTNGVESDFSDPELSMVFDGSSRILRFFTPVQIQNPVVQMSRDLVNWSTISGPILSETINGGMDWFVANPGGTSFFRLMEQ
jgi:hypothetical protein